MGPGSTALPPATALAASPSPTSGKHDTRAAEDDTHDDCPFRQLLSVRPASCTLLPRTSSGMGRGGRLSDTRGGGKSVRFADTVTGPDGLPVTPGTRRKLDVTTPYKNGVVNTGKFYRRSDGRFVTRGGSRRPATAKERVTPSSARPQAAGQYSLGKTSQYQQQFECRKNCQFKEQVSNRPHKSVHKTWRSLASEGRPRLVGEGPRRSRMKVTGVSAPRWEHVDNKQKGDASSAKQCPPKPGKGRDEVDEKCSAAYKNALLVGWPKFEANRKVASQRTRSLSCPQNSPVIQRPRFRTSSAPVGSTSAAISPTTTTSCSAASPRSTSASVTRGVHSSASRNISHHSSKSNTSLCDHLASRAATRSSFSPKTWPFCSAKSQSYHGVGCRYWRAPCPLPWFLQVDVPRPGPLYLGVLPGLYVGNIRDSKDSDQLKTHNITHILAIHDNARKLPCNSDKEYLCITASDSPGQNLMQYFPACNDFIHTARLKGGAVLIHCLAGMSRSVTVAVVYVMCVTSLSWRDALKVVRGARNVANPNVGFLKQLQDFESDRMAEERRRLKAKYPSVTLKEEDEQMAKTLLASYYHSLSVGEMCEGNCPPGVTCPRGICHPARRTGLFRRNSRESSGSRSSSPSRRSSSPSSTSSSPATSPVPPRRASPTPPSPLTRRNSNSSPQLTPPQHGSPNNQRGSSTNRSSMQASSPSSSPKRCSSPSSPKRGSSPVRSLSSSPNSSPATSPKHVYTPFISPRTTYTSPPGSPKRCPSPVASPKRSLSAPNSPQRTVKKATLSPRSMLRQCSLWQHSIKVNGVDSKSKYISGLVVVDGDRELTQKEKELLRSLEEKGVPIRQLRPDSVGGPHLSKQTSLPLQSTQEKSPTYHRPLQKQTSLPPQPKSSSHPCHPTVLGSYLQIYRQSSLPEECEDHTDNTIPSSDQQLYRWITRQSQPPEPLPCPYDELFRQASLQESRYKPKSSPLNTNQMASEEKKNKHNDLKSEEKDETQTLLRLASDNQVDKTIKRSSERDLTVSKTSCSKDLPATPATIVTPATPTTPATPVTSISPIMSTTSTPSTCIEPTTSSTYVTPTTPVTSTTPATSITSTTTTTSTVVTSSISTRTTNSSETSTSVASAKPTKPVVSSTPAKPQDKTQKEKEVANTSPKKGAAAKNSSTKRTPTPPIPSQLKQKQSTSSKSSSQLPKTKTPPPLKSDHEQPAQATKGGGETQFPQGKEGKSVVNIKENQDSNIQKRHTSESPTSSRSTTPPRPHSKPGFAMKQDEANYPRNKNDSITSEPSRKDHKEAHPPKDNKHAIPIKKRNSSPSMKHDSKPVSSMKKEPKPGSSVKQNTALDSCLKQDKKPGFPVKQDSQSKSDSTPLKDREQESPLKQDKPGAPKNKEHKSDSHLHKESNPESSSSTNSKPGANLNRDLKQEFYEQQSTKAGIPLKEDHNTESFLNKNQKPKFPLKQDQESDSSSKHDQKSDGSLKKDQKSDSSSKHVQKPDSPLRKDQKSNFFSKHDQKSDSSLKKDKKSDSSLKQDPKSYSSLKRDKKSDSSLKKDQKLDSSAKQDHKYDSNLKKGLKSESSLKNEQKSDSSSKQDQKYDSTLKKDKKSDSIPKKDKKSDCSSKQDQNFDATLKKDKRSDSFVKQDKKTDPCLKKKEQQSEFTLEKDKKPDSSLRKDLKSDLSIKHDQKSESSSSRDQNSESLRHNHKSKFPIKQDEKLDSCSKQDQKSESPLRQEKSSESPMKRDHKPGTPMKQEYRSGSPLKQEFRPESPLKQDYRPGSPLIQDFRPGSPLKKDSRPNSPSFGPVVISRPSTPLSASPPPPKLPPPPQSPKRSGVRRRGSAASLGTDGRRTQTKPECYSRNNLPDSYHQTSSPPSHAPQQTTGNIGPQARSPPKQPTRPSTPIQEQPRSSPPLPASPRPLPYYHNQVDQPACPPCLPIQSRPRASLEPLTCPAKPPSNTLSSNSNTVMQNSVSENGVSPSTEPSKPKLNSCPPRQNNIKQPLTDTRPTPNAAHQAPSVIPQPPSKALPTDTRPIQNTAHQAPSVIPQPAPKAPATNIEAKDNDNDFQIIQNKQDEPPFFPRDKEVTETPPIRESIHSSATPQGKTFQNFHELFKKCSVKNQQQTESSLQTVSSMNSETHQQALTVQTSLGLPSK